MQGKKRCLQTAELCPRLKGLLNQVFWKIGWLLTSDVRADCESEALLVAHRLQAQSTEVRSCAYCSTSVRHRIWEFLTPELRHRRATIPLEELHNAPDLLADKATEPWRLFLARAGLREQVAHEELAQALAVMREHDCTILDLYYRLGLSEKEIAQRQGISEAAANKAHSRAVQRLRKKAQAAPRE